MPKSNRVGRNEPCPCRSGKKFKRCCAIIRNPGEQDEETAAALEMSRKAQSHPVEFLYRSIDQVAYAPASSEYRGQRRDA